MSLDGLQLIFNCGFDGLLEGKIEWWRAISAINGKKSLLVVSPYFPVPSKGAEDFQFFLNSVLHLSTLLVRPVDASIIGGVSNQQRWWRPIST